MSDPYFHTWSAQAGRQALPVAGGQGAYVTTTDGESWLDLGSLSYQANLGHGHPRMVAAIKSQAETLCLASPNVDYPAKRELAHALLKLAPPGFTRVFFALGGSEAIENAMKISRLQSGRFKFVSRYRSYHGATYGALSLTGDHRRAPLEPCLGGITRVTDDAQIPSVLKAEGNVAAVFLESIPGANGVLITPKSVWKGIREACDEHQTLLCVDEVLTGFGRTGTCFGFEQFDIVPDLICLAKGLTGGYAPLGAVLVHEKVAKFFDDNTLWAGLTNYAHPLGCAAGREALALYREGNLYTKGKTLEPVLLGALQNLADAFPKCAFNPRGLGLLAAVDLSLTPELWQRLARELEARRVLTHVYPARGYVVFAPPLVISENELIEGMGRIEDALASTLSAH